MDGIGFRLRNPQFTQADFAVHDLNRPEGATCRRAWATGWHSTRPGQRRNSTAPVSSKKTPQLRQSRRSANRFRVVGYAPYGSVCVKSEVTRSRLLNTGTIHPERSLLCVGLSSRGQKGRFDTLPVCSPYRLTAKAAMNTVVTMRTQAQSRYPSWKQVFRPYALGFVGLAIVVALWGFGYKLSLYHRHAEPSARTLVAKMWIEPRNASATASSKLKEKSHVFSGSQALSIPLQKRPNLNRAVVFALPPPTRCVAYLDSRIPSRPPPPYRFCVA